MEATKGECQGKKVLMAGDLNFNTLKRDSSSMKFIEISESYGFTLYLNTPTIALFIHLTITSSSVNGTVDLARYYDKAPYFGSAPPPKITHSLVLSGASQYQY